MQRITLRLLLEYARCPLAYWWRGRARIEPPLRAEALPEQAMRRGLAHYYTSRADSILDGVASAWQEWLTEWQCSPEAIEQLRQYVTSFSQPPAEPEQALRCALQASPPATSGEYSVLSALNDSILLALRYTGPERDPNGNTRVNVPFEVPVTDGILISGQADLVVMANGSITTAEIHDYRAYRPPATVLSRHLGIIALFHAQGEEVGWKNRQHVVIYRHMHTGLSLQVDGERPRERLLPVITAALRGVQHGVYLPRLAVAEQECLSCAYYGLCVTKDGWDVLDDLDATLAALPHQQQATRGM